MFVITEKIMKRPVYEYVETI